MENVPFVDDLSVIWNGGEDLPVGVTRRIDDGVVVVEFDECLRLLVGLSRCESATNEKRKFIIFFI